MDEPITTILKTVAYGELCRDDEGGECLYCHVRESLSQTMDALPIVHEATCIVILARQALSQAGMPLLLYQIAFQQLHAVWETWHYDASYHLAYDEQEVLEHWLPQGVWGQPRRNRKIILIGEA